MKGEDLKRILTSNGYVLQNVAERLNMSQPNFSKSLTVADVKTGLLEKICDACGLDMSFFYPNSIDLASKELQVGGSTNTNDKVRSSDSDEVKRLEELLKERTEALALVQSKYIALLEKNQDAESSLSHTA